MTHILKPKITLPYKGTNYTTPIILMAQSHGGTSMLIKWTIEHYELLKYAEVSIQATSIKVKEFTYEITITAF